MICSIIDSELRPCKNLCGRLDSSRRSWKQAAELPAPAGNAKVLYPASSRAKTEVRGMPQNLTKIKPNQTKPTHIKTRYTSCGNNLNIQCFLRLQVQNGLKERGYDVTRLNTYDTVSAKWSAAEEEAAKAAGIVTLASPSAVKTWAKRVGVSQVIPPLHSFRGLHSIRLLTSHPRTGGGLHWGDECSGLQGGRL